MSEALGVLYSMRRDIAKVRRGFAASGCMMDAQCHICVTFRLVRRSRIRTFAGVDLRIVKEI
jgi:hypothetical protein